ncbi:hypothetical protein V2A60_005700 [Cordyceps javanica]|uniref:DUF7708 domain-containing protein n=1 Tax=Cordyceps javanica TaxID=43265 RepID=A0A545VXU7_9HYPO|nr:hypothetical protein IF1G_06686 [Cordyceps javanica]TQW06548.1 hypothetical protein IF2G_05970 [Cordyceps javanica]
MKCRDYQAFADYWLDISKHGKDDLERARQRGWKKWAARYQTFGCGVLGFMKDWDPFVNAVAKNKDETESSIATAFMSIRDRIIGFKMYQDIYKESNALESDLRAKIVDAYSAVITLAIEATWYYKGGGLRRLLRTIGDSGKFKRLASDVEDSIVAIRLRCDDLLSQNVHGLEQKMDDLAWNEFCSAWKLAHLSSDQSRVEGLALYRRDLSHNLRPDMDQFSARDHQRLAFEASSQHRTWADPGRSAVLILVGYTEQSIATFQPYCWLSPWVLDLIGRCRRERRHHAYYILPAKGEVVALERVVATLLLQLVRLKMPALRDDDARRRGLMDAYAAAADTRQPAGQRVGASRALAPAVLALFDEGERVDVLVDRLDKCAAAQRVALLDVLGAMARAARCTVKVVVIVSGSDWAFEDCDLDRDYAHHVVVYRAAQQRSKESADE